MLQSIKREKLYEKVSEQILQSISSGEFPHGSRLPSERELADTLQVSRTVIREAFRSMESVGYIESRSNGMYVREFSMDDLIDPIMSILSQDDHVVDDLLELRLILEPSATSLAARRITPEQLDELEAILTGMEQCVKAGQNGSQYDARFHKRLVDFSRNEALKSVYKMCESALLKVIESIGSIKQQPEIACAGHRKIYQAEAGDSQAAKQAMYDHLEQVYVRLGRQCTI